MIDESCLASFLGGVDELLGLEGKEIEVAVASALFLA